MPVTPFSQLLDSGIYTVTMPETVTVGSVVYRFVQWEDGSVSPIRQISLTTPISIVAYYVSQQLLEINSSGVTGITFTLTRV